LTAAQKNALFTRARDLLQGDQYAMGQDTQGNQIFGGALGIRELINRICLQPRYTKQQSLADSVGGQLASTERIQDVTMAFAISQASIFISYKIILLTIIAVP
jgi:hypothetical protein